ncbi:hypothetical protein OAL67_01085 [bacterium]|nr:hypothetical protein [bacterium]
MVDVKNLIISLSISILVIVALKLIGKFSGRELLTRKIAHVSTAGIYYIYSLFMSVPTLVIMLSVLITILLMLRRVSPILGLQTEKQNYREIYYLLALVLYSFAAEDSFMLIMFLVILAIPDTVLGLLRELDKSYNTILINLVSLVMYVVLCLVLYWERPLLGIFLGILLSFVERHSTRGLDNITVPTTLSLIAFLT